MKLPTYQESEKRVLADNGSATLIDIFIYNCSPDDYNSQSTFRWHLQRLVDSLTDGERISKTSHLLMADYLLVHEKEIARGEGSFGALMGLFLEIYDRPPEE